MPNSELAKYVKTVGMKGISDGLTADSKGSVVFGNVEESAVFVWQSGQPINTAKIIAQDASVMQWPDTFAWASGNEPIVYFVSNKLQLFTSGTMKFDGSDGANFRIFQLNVTADSYLTGNPIPPQMQCQVN